MFNCYRIRYQEYTTRSPSCRGDRGTSDPRLRQSTHDAFVCPHDLAVILSAHCYDSWSPPSRGSLSHLLITPGHTSFDTTVIHVVHVQLYAAIHSVSSTFSVYEGREVLSSIDLYLHLVRLQEIRSCFYFIDERSPLDCVPPTPITLSLARRIECGGLLSLRPNLTKTTGKCPPANAQGDDLEIYGDGVPEGQ